MDINYDSIAKGWLKIMEDMDNNHGENNLDIISIGMIPAFHFEMLTEGIFEKICQDMTAEGARFSFMDAKDLRPSLKDEFINEVNKEMTLSIYRCAKMVV